MIGTPDEIIKRITAAQKACSFSEITIVTQFGDMPYEEAIAEHEAVRAGSAAGRACDGSAAACRRAAGPKALKPSLLSA